MNPGERELLKTNRNPSVGEKFAKRAAEDGRKHTKVAAAGKDESECCVSTRRGLLKRNGFKIANCGGVSQGREENMAVTG